MNIKNVILGLLLMLFFVACSTSKTLSPEQLIKQQEIFDKVESGNFKIQAWQAIPMRGGSIPLTSRYDMTIRNDSAFAYLPFFGRATYVSFSGEGGIKFAEAMKDYQSRLNKKGDGYDVNFNINTIEYQYKIFISIYNNGQCNMNISSNQKDPMNFSGNIMLDE